MTYCKSVNNYISQLKNARCKITPEFDMKHDALSRESLGGTPAKKGGKDAVVINKSRLQRLAEITQKEPGELREQILDDLLDQIVGAETFELIECFVSPFYTKEQAEAVAERFNAFGSGKAGGPPARVVIVGKRFAVIFADAN